MPLKRVNFRTFAKGLWLAGPRENAPEDALRRAVGVAGLRYGSIRSRSGSALLLALDAHSVVRWKDKRIVGAGTGLFYGVLAGSEVGISTEQVLSGNRWTAEPMPPTAESSPVDDRLWVADSSWPVKIKSDFTSQRWGITAPTLAPTTGTKSAQAAKTIEDCDTAASFVTNGNISVFGNSTLKKLQGTGSIAGTVAKNSEGTIDRTTTLDLSQFSAPGDSADQDYIELSVAFLRPKHVKNIEIAFLVGAGVPASFDNMTDSYSRELRVKTLSRKKTKKLRGTADLVFFKDQKKFLEEHSAASGRDLSTSEFIQEDEIAVSRRTWTRITIPKSSFTANGAAGTTGFTWANVRGFRISIETTNAGTAPFWIDNIRMLGGVGMQGDYKWTYTYRNSGSGERSNPPIDSDGNILFKLVQDVERQAVVVTGFQVSTDPQVDFIEVWRTLGNGEVYFKAGQVANSGTPSFTDVVADHIGMFADSGGSPTILQPLELPLDNDPPPAGIFDCAKHGARMFVVTNSGNNAGRLYHSPIGRPGSAGADFLEVTANDDPIQKIVEWNGSLWVFTLTGLFQIAQDDVPFAPTPVYGAPGAKSGSGRTVVPTPRGILYQANDGVRMFDGVSTVLAAEDALRPVFRGATTNGIAGMAGVIATYGRDEYYISDTVGTTLGLDCTTQAWRNIGVPARALYYEAETGLLLATFQSALFATGVIIVVSNNSTFVPNTTSAAYVSFAIPAATGSTAAAVYVRMPEGATLTDVRVRLSVALGGGGTFTLKPVINGVDSSSLNVLISSGGSTGSAAGSLAVAQDDLVCFHAVFTGGTTSATVRSITIAYQVAI